MNKVLLTGRLTADPEVRYTQEQKAVATYTLAVDRRFAKNAGDERQTADYIRCIAFEKKGEFAEKYLRKGIKIAVEGRIQTGSYTNREGKKVYTTDVIVEQQEFCETKKDSVQAAPAPIEPQKADDGFMDVSEDIDEELPFV